MKKQAGGEKKTQRRRRRRHICMGAASIITPNGFCLAECSVMQPVWSGCRIATHAEMRKEIYWEKKCAESSGERRHTRQAGKDLAAALRSVARLGASILGLNVKVGQDRCGWLS